MSNSIEIKSTDNVETTNEVNTTIKRDFAPHRRASARICKTCGRFYIISDNDVMWYIQKFGTMPLRCEVCREKNRTDDKSETTDNAN